MSRKEPVVECVPNFSEGRDARRVEAIVAAMRVEGVHLLDWSMDPDHNRSVVTVAGSPASVVESAVRGAGKACELIDLTRQQGAHPRIGAADVIPFVPIQGIKLEQCVLLARQAGHEIWQRFGVPIYFYEAAAARPDRANLDDVRRGQFEGLRDVVRKEAARRPDLGGPALHPTAGACAVGARKFLVSYNLYFDTADVSVVRAIAREVRADSGGLNRVKA
ncbi:MAG TPA: glutamate formimidoyltransferase, partial [Terracidiphilus sp.]|nr:glutamate formimidoyltransferase [Terracidiphilus sp.]